MCHLWLACRCGRLRTWCSCWPRKAARGGGLGAADLIARLPALASGAPGLRALQVVLPIDAAQGGLGPLWRALEALPSLASLALGCAFYLGEPTKHMGEDIADVLDAARVRQSWAAAVQGP